MPDSHAIILFDGVCNLCNSAVNFVIRQDKRDRFRFAALQSLSGTQLLERYRLPLNDFQSFVLIEGDRVYQRSSAALKIAKQLPWYWQWTRMFYLLPVSLRDGLYNFVARHRYHWFGRRATCMVPTAALKKKFLP